MTCTAWSVAALAVAALAAIVAAVSAWRLERVHAEFARVAAEERFHRALRTARKHRMRVLADRAAAKGATR